jgi:hypothetical protein
MQEMPVQILEVRAGEGERPVTITAALTAEASHAIFIALSEQLDRRRQPAASVEHVLALRAQTALLERLAAQTPAIPGLPGLRCPSTTVLRLVQD